MMRVARLRAVAIANFGSEPEIRLLPGLLQSHARAYDPAGNAGWNYDSFGMEFYYNAISKKHSWRPKLYLTFCSLALWAPAI
jgi:hypothetical protein